MSSVGEYSNPSMTSRRIAPEAEELVAGVERHEAAHSERETGEQIKRDGRNADPVGQP
jgi:hypothetical protein